MAEHKLRGDFESRKIWLDGVELSPEKSQKIYNHSPDGFSWGYGGSGPSQLALAICLELMGDEGQFFYQRFKWNFIAKLPQADFDVTFNDKILKEEEA
jgi:hypothetical protein